MGWNLLLYFNSTWRYRMDGYRPVSSLALSSSTKTFAWGVGIVETKACMGKNGAAGLGFYTKEALAHLGSPFGFGCLLDGFFSFRFSRRSLFE